MSTKEGGHGKSDRQHGLGICPVPPRPGSRADADGEIRLEPTGAPGVHRLWDRFRRACQAFHDTRAPHEGHGPGYRQKGVPVAPLGSTRWRRPEDPRNTGAEPDACYYLGETAERWDETFPLDEDAQDAFALENPPDLVIEFERSSGDGDKPLAYRRLGVPEMWRIDISGNVREAVMLNLQAPGGPAELESSAVLSGATPAFVLEALALAIRRRFPELDALIAGRLSD